ncbi:MAG: glucose-6-phosphate isomerase [Deltaproteobacteria bacterium]|nr:glucose-6-phosphate isomerase [Deltaproteobacteria bacterium]
MLSRTHLPSWKNLVAHQHEMAAVHMRDLFAQDCSRFQRFSLQLDDLLFDFSKNRITQQTLELLVALANQSGLSGQINAMFTGAAINTTEQRAALHTALRNRSSRSVTVNGHDVMPDICYVLEQMRTFSQSVRTGSWHGYTGKPITTIVNIGIGGSDLGPRLVTQALKSYSASHLKMIFISGVDPCRLEEVFPQLDPETTLFIVASKSFTTSETMLNAAAARAWLVGSLGDTAAVGDHFVAVTSNHVAAVEFGIKFKSVFELWDWVGGRYSLWSAVGLPIAISIGMDQFEQLLEGAYAMDEHFRSAPWHENIPVVMALLGVWYNNFFNVHSHAVLPYDPSLQLLPAYLQQLDMESNGKGCTRDGVALNYASGPIVWGELGMDSQHAFYQHLHQGTEMVPCDLLCAAQSRTDLYGDNNRRIIANCMAQSKALLTGKTENEVRAELLAAGAPQAEAERLVPHKVFPGNRPSNTILYRQLTPKVLGNLLALYEHRTFVQGVVWDVNSFDQWGVELGKTLAKDLNQELMRGVSVVLNRCLAW